MSYCLCGSQIKSFIFACGAISLCPCGGKFVFLCPCGCKLFVVFRLCGGKFVFYACVALNCEFYLRLRGDKFMPVRRQLVPYACVAVEL